jgi:transposase InsO family protein
VHSAYPADGVPRVTRELRRQGVPVRRRLEIRQSTGRTGSCLDGAAAESFFATIKAEIGAESWPDHSAARRDIENSIKSYNEKRLHSSIGYQTPIEARTAWQERMATAA